MEWVVTVVGEAILLVSMVVRDMLPYTFPSRRPWQYRAACRGHG